MPPSTHPRVAGPVGPCALPSTGPPATFLCRVADTAARRLSCMQACLQGLSLHLTLQPRRQMPSPPHVVVHDPAHRPARIISSSLHACNQWVHTNSLHSRGVRAMDDSGHLSCTSSPPLAHTHVMSFHMPCVPSLCLRLRNILPASRARHLARLCLPCSPHSRSV